MANRIGDDDSSDDDFSDNLQLAERLRINRENKISNFHQKKNFLDDQSSSSSSLEMRPEFHKDRQSRVYCSYNKKRQNGDKNAEQFANPKRTCLSNRFLKSPDYQHKKKLHPGHYPVSDLAHCSTDSATKHLFADKTYEDHFHNLADGENPAFNSSKEYSKKRIFNNLSEQRRPIEDVSYVPPKVPECQKQKNNEKEMKKERAEADSPKQFRWKQPLCHNGEHSRSLDNGTMRPVPYRPPHLPGFYQASIPSVSDRNTVHYVDSASDEDSRPVMKNGSLKGGRQSPDMSQNHKKVLGRKIKKKVLDSDDTDDDWTAISLPAPSLVFSSSSDSDEEEIEAIRKGGLKSLIPPEELANHPLSAREEGHSNRELYHNQGEAFQACFAKGGFAEPSSSPTIVYHSKSPSSRSCRTRKYSRNNAPPELSPARFHPNRSGGSAVRGRNRVNVGERLSRRSGSPHPRTLPSSHTRMTRAVVSKTSRGRSLTGSHSRRANLNLATTYPDLFDAEDSSEVEFFTANSYSDTETSAESFGGLRISTTVRNPENNGVICEHSINVGSSEDEISVVFSTGPSSGHLRRENQAVRNGDFRNRTPRTLGRRNNKRRSPHQPRESFREIVSLSPDPVEQVQQVEDDERFARMLQAQFDAEVDPDFDPSVRHPPTNPHFVYELPNTPESIDTDLGDSDNEFDLSLSHPSLDNGFNTSHSQNLHFAALQSARHRGYRSSRFPLRPTTPNFFGSIFYNNRRVDRNRRRPAANEARRLSTLANLFEANLIGDILSSDDSFETFLGLAELNGDVPRGLQKSEINRLPTRQYLAANGASPSTDLPHKRAGLNKECQVCLSDYENGDTLRILPCFHEFHTPCIDPWLKINHTCPVCRVVVDLGG